VKIGITPTNLIGNGVATIVIAKWENALDEGRLQQVLSREISEPALAQPQPL
jgi:aerobic C4-dicarboxylate transport protein